VTVLSQAALEASPLADLHAIASELGIDGFRRLRRPDLIDAILAHQDGSAGAEEAAEVEEAAEPEEAAEAEEPRARRSRRGGRGRGRETREQEDRAAPATREPDEAHVVEGVVELLGNGSGFVRADDEDAGDDVYISAAQVRRCELVSGDRISGPVRRPRRSERHPSLIRVDTINGVPAEEVAEGTPFDALPAAHPDTKLDLGKGDKTLEAIAKMTPIGKGSRATIVGGARAGKTEALRRIGATLAGQDGLEVTTVLVGVRPEELGDWKEAGIEPAASLSFASSADAQAQALERAVDTAKRLAARGGDAVLLVDSLDGVHAPAARKALAAARNIVDGGSLTVIATSLKPLGGESTVIALDAARTAANVLPAIDLALSGTIRPELLVGTRAANAIVKARKTALEAA
jgi:transcription termination factor Rho